MAKKRRYHKNRIQWSQKKIRRMLILTAVLIVPPFILWGISTAIRSQKNLYIGKIGNWTITRPLWIRELRHTQVDMLLKSGNRDIPPKLANILTWNRLISLYAVKKARIKVSDRELADFIRSMKIFQDENQKFSINRYQNILNYLGVDEKSFEETIRENLAIQKLIDKITSDLSVSEEEVKKSWEKEKERFKISYLKLDYKDLMPPPTSVSENEITQYYQSHRDEFVIPTFVKIKYLIVPKGQKIPQVANLDALAKKLNLEVKERELKEEQILPEIGLSEEFYSYAFSLPPGKISPVIDLPSGDKCLLEVTEKTPKHIGTLAEVKKQIIERIRLEKAKDLALKRAKNLLDTPSELAKEKWISIEEFSPQVPFLPELGPTSEVLKEIKKALKEGRKFAILPRQHATFVIKIEKYTPAPQEIPEKEKERIRKTLIEQKKMEKFNQYIRKLLEKTKIDRKDDLL